MGPPSIEVDADGRVCFYPGRISLKRLEIVVLELTLKANKWNKTKTANDLEISRSAVYDKIKEYRLVEPIP